MENSVVLPPFGREGSLMATEITVASAIAIAENTICLVVIFVAVYLKL